MSTWSAEALQLFKYNRLHTLWHLKWTLDTPWFWHMQPYNQPKCSVPTISRLVFSTISVHDSYLKVCDYMSNLSFNQPINIVAELQKHFDVTMNNRLDKQHSCAQEGEQYFSTLNAFISLNVQTMSITNNPSNTLYLIQQRVHWMAGRPNNRTPMHLSINCTHWFATNNTRWGFNWDWGTNPVLLL